MIQPSWRDSEKFFFLLHWFIFSPVSRHFFTFALILSRITFKSLLCQIMKSSFLSYNYDHQPLYFLPSM